MASLYVPVATNCCFVPLAIDGVAGVTAIDTSVAAVTVSVVLPVIPAVAAEMTVVPAATPVARPSEPAALEIVAVAGVADVHVTVLVRFPVVASLYVPVATNWRVVPLAIDGFAGVTAIDTSVASVTVRVVFPLIAPRAAEMVVVPAATLVARPAEPAALEIVAVAGVDDAHVTEVVKFCVVPSLYVPVATNCRLVPFAIDGVGGVTAIDTSVAAVTVSVVLPLIPAVAAEMTVVPAATLVARPSEPAALEIVAAAGVADVHVTVAVRFCVVPSPYVPVATNCCLVPFAIDGVAGVTAIETRVAPVTVRVVLPLIAPLAAEMTVVPAATPVARPAEPAALEIVAVAGVADAQVAVAVRFCVVPSL